MSPQRAPESSPEIEDLRAASGARDRAAPMRRPNADSAEVMTRRGWWLIALNFLIPGSAQSVAGNRRLGRIGLAATLTMWALGLLAVALGLFAPQVLLSIATHPVGLVLAQALLIGYAVLWVTLSLNTLALVRVPRARPGARAALILGAVALLAVSSGTAAVGAYYANATARTLGSMFGGGAPSEPPTDGYYNILLLGGDAGPDREGMRPDSLSVVSVNASTGQATMIGLPRDMLRVPFVEGSPMAALYPDGFQRCDVSACKLNSIYTEAELRRQALYPQAAAEGSSAGIEATKDAAEGLTGLRIPYYALVDMQGFSDLIDALGGVEVTPDKRIPIGGDEQLRGVAEWIEPGTQRMDGYHAQWYARSRHGTSDFDRMARQRELQEAVLRQFTPQNVLTKFEAVASAGTRVVTTDLPQDMLGSFAVLALKTRDLPVQNLELTPAEGIDQDNPDVEEIRSRIRTLLHPQG